LVSNCDDTALIDWEADPAGRSIFGPISTPSPVIHSRRSS
jgi:hypothetical protein